VEHPPFGYADTPLIPGSPWRVHDPGRPQPRVVDPGPPPSDAVRLFDGQDLSEWEDAAGDAPRWTVVDGCMVVAPGGGSVQTRRALGDCQLHVEWAAPGAVEGDDQARGNSGVFLLKRYEIQILDSYNNPTYADGAAASVYGQHPPLVNPSRAPGEWQSYDIIWISPRFEGEQLKSPARLTLLYNGIIVHYDRELLGPTAHREVLRYRPHAPEGPLMLQNHGSAVRFRNIWCRPLTF
jgi:hypothetical protein